MQITNNTVSNKIKMKLEAVKKELDSKKFISLKYKNLLNDHKDLQKRNKDLVITIQKMKSDNLILTQYHHLILFL